MNPYYLSYQKSLSFQIQKVYAKQMFITKISQNEYYRYLISAADFRDQASRDQASLHLDWKEYDNTF